MQAKSNNVSTIEDRLLQIEKAINQLTSLYSNQIAIQNSWHEEGKKAINRLEEKLEQITISLKPTTIRKEIPLNTTDPSFYAVSHQSSESSSESSEEELLQATIEDTPTSILQKYKKHHKPRNAVKFIRFPRREAYVKEPVDNFALFRSDLRSKRKGFSKSFISYRQQLLKVYFLKQVARREYFNKEIYLPPAPQISFHDSSFFSTSAMNEEIPKDSVASEDLSDGFPRNELIYVESPEHSSDSESVELSKMTQVPKKPSAAPKEDLRAPEPVFVRLDDLRIEVPQRNKMPVVEQVEGEMQDKVLTSRGPRIQLDSPNLNEEEEFNVKEVIEDCIQEFEADWRDAELPKYTTSRQRDIWNMMQDPEKSEEFEKERKHIVKRIDTLKSKIYEANINSSEADVRRACEALRESVNHRMKLIFYFEIQKQEFSDFSEEEPLKKRAPKSIPTSLKTSVSLDEDESDPNDFIDDSELNKSDKLIEKLAPKAAVNSPKPKSVSSIGRKRKDIIVLSEEEGEEEKVPKKQKQGDVLDLLKSNPVEEFMNHTLRKLIDEHKESEAVDRFIEFKKKNRKENYEAFPIYREILNLINSIEEVQVRSSATPNSQRSTPQPPQAQSTLIDVDSSSLDESETSETTDSEKETVNMQTSTILPRKRKNIKKILSQSQLTPETIKAQQEEEHRKKQFLRNQKRTKLSEDLLEMNKRKDSTISNSNGEKSVLVNPVRAPNESEIYLHPDLARKIMSHQIEAVQFIWQGVLPVEPGAEGSGVLLAHAMGLGKTFTTIAFVHTYLANKKGTHVLILLPTAVLINWEREFDKWIPKKSIKVEVYAVSTGKELESQIENWEKGGGVLMMSYELFKVQVKKYTKELLEIPDLVICDEAHRIQNSKTNVTLAVKQIKTKQRICLTGEPFQNCLSEYWCMVDFIKPGVLGNEREFNNLFENPINNGRCIDSTPDDIKLAKWRAYVLHHTLKPFMLRKDESIMEKLLPKKEEIVIWFRISELQRQLYSEFTKTISPSEFLTAYKHLELIGSHPRIVRDRWRELNKEKGQNDSEKSTNIDPIESLLAHPDVDKLESGPKMHAILKLLQIFRKLKEKCVIFTSSKTHVIKFLEYLLTENKIQFIKLTGDTSSNQRQQYVDMFNDPYDRNEVFIISKKAGGNGLNIPGATRVILVDIEWNPSHDTEAAARCWRFGQTRPTFVYRLVNTGTVEHKIYKRQWGKVAMAKRVIDDKPIKSSLRNTDVNSTEFFYLFGEDSNAPIMLPENLKDRALEMLLEDPEVTKSISQISRHNNMMDEDLDKMKEDEKQKAKEEYNTAREKEGERQKEKLIRKARKSTRTEVIEDVALHDMDFQVESYETNVNEDIPAPNFKRILGRDTNSNSSGAKKDNPIVL